MIDINNVPVFKQVNNNNKLQNVKQSYSHINLLDFSLFQYSDEMKKKSLKKIFISIIVCIKIVNILYH